MSTETVIEVTRDGPIEILRLTRPDRLNAIDATMLSELIAAGRRIRKDDSIHCVILTGGPRSDGRPCFSAGDDLIEAAAGETPSGNPGRVLTDLIDEMLTPWIAAIDGVCTTGALELALACDLRFVADTARISDWHLARLGSGLGGWGASTRLSRLVGVAQASDLILTGKEIDGAEALRIGLAQRMVASEDLWDETITAAKAIGSMSRAGVRMTLAHLSRVEDLDKAEALRFADQVRQWMPSTSTFKEAAERVLGPDRDRPSA